MMTAEPDYEVALGLVKHLSTEELRELINNEERLQELIRDLPQMKNLSSEKEMLLTANRSLAEYNMSIEPKLSEGRQDLICKYEESASLADDVRNMKAQRDQSGSKHAPDTIQALLQTAAHEKEEETENLIQTFLDNICPVDEFIPEFIRQRSVAHDRRIKAEKLAELLKHNQGSVVTTPWATPYPTSLPNMPMPIFP